MRRTLEPQDRISRYSVVGPLGVGGMGEVYVAKDESLDRNVALKVLPPNLVRDEDRVRRFVLEAKSASSLNHPNIVTIYEIGQDRVRVAGADGPDPGSDPVHYISMELVSGESLSQKIHEEKTDLRTLLGYLAQAAEGIAKAHAAGIVHRDLKPGNIMVSRDGFAKVLDFGLAKLTEKGSVATAPDATSAPTEMPGTGAGAIMGTVGYMSPEQVQGKPVDARSDVFALGCVIYEAATRKRPFAAESDVETMHRILRDRPTAVEEINPQVPADVRRIIRRCLAKSPDERFQSMKDLAIELREAHDEYESLPMSGPSGSSVITGSVGAPPRSRRGMILGIAAGIVVVAALAGGWLAFGKRGASGVVAPSHDMKMNVLMSRDDIDEFVISADGRYLAFVTSAEEKTSLNVRQVRTGTDVRILPPQDFAIHGVSFSPDGDYLYYLNQDPQLPNYQALFQVASLGGTPRKVFFDVDTAAAISPDGARACFRRGEPNTKADTLVVGDFATGKDRLLVRIRAPEAFISAPVWSPDGKHVAVAHQEPVGEVRTHVSVLDVESGHEEAVGSQPFTVIESLAWLPDGSGLVVSGFYRATAAPQIFRVAYPTGETRKLTNDLSGYSGLSFASTGNSIAAMRRTIVNNVWAVEGEGAEAHPVTRASGASGSATEPTPLAGGDVVYAVLEGERSNLWRARPDGSAARKLTSSDGLTFAPRDAGKAGIVFGAISNEVFTPHVWRIDADGGGLRQLTSGKGELNQDVAPDGTTVLFQQIDDPASIWSLSLAGGEPQRIASDTTGDRPAFSPDGTMILYTDFATIDGRIRARSVVIPRAGGEPIARFVLPPGAVFQQWAPDSKSITYVDRNEGWNVMRQPVAGGAPMRLTRFTEGVTTSYKWSPDGTRLGVVRRIGSKVGLWIVTPGKGEPKRIAEFQTGTITDLRFSPDSKTAFFTYGTSSKDVVLISDFQ